ncbi:lipase [Halovibrio salipaludis]|uniref:Lipase n=1 Tax=Halovibrio salipaludis TaxID=2032626 RepID=A0A2A2FCE8_9GAMM|nr:lipase family protein [Halovibrio salipaludis]PAU82292.1 lipase [Halovibrio salipaludis]
METLSPSIAAECADAVYSVFSPDSMGNIPMPLSTQLERRFSFKGKPSPVMGETGGIFGLYTQTTGFAVIGEGRERHRNSTLIAIRGSSSIADYLTDFDVGIATGINNQSVHSGFEEAFASMRPSFNDRLAKRLTQAGPNHTVHCVGHSLGGALASLTADWLKSQFPVKVKLYTFGAPRVGLKGYATKNTNQIDAHYRCTHGADPVPLAPVWPFIHAPNEGAGEYRLDSAEGINFSAHRMGHKGTPGYRNTAETDDWGKLKRQSMRFLNQTVRLRYEDRLQASFTNYWSEKLNAALITLLKDAGYYSVVAGQATMSSALTFYDRLARSLEKIAEASTEFAEQTAGLLGHMLVFAGKAAVTVTKLTYQFIRWVFETTIGTLNRSVKKALESL